MGITTNHFANILNIKTVIHSCKDAFDKVKRLKKLYNLDEVAMVGDALNDRNTFLSSRLGIAIETADNTHTQSAADVVVQHHHLTSILHLFDISKMTFSAVQQGIFISLLYNLATIALTTVLAIHLGAFAPCLMALTMTIQSLIVFANSWRLMNRPLSKPEASATQPSHCFAQFFKPATHTQDPLPSNTERQSHTPTQGLHT